jgi:hypothetical protein
MRELVHLIGHFDQLMLDLGQLISGLYPLMLKFGHLIGEMVGDMYQLKLKLGHLIGEMDQLSL